MLKQTELEFLKADLAGVQSLLASRSKQADPIGYFQLNARRQELQEEIDRLEQESRPTVQLGLFFGGKPVSGTKGIDASFAGKTLKSFQDIVAKRYAAMETGHLSQCGPIPMRGNAQLLITDVIRGSFGFVLEENPADQEESPTDQEDECTSLKSVVDDVVSLINLLCSSEESAFDSATESLDDRILISLKEFFRTLDEGEATIRMVEEQTEYSLGRESIKRARERTESMVISERDDEVMSGTLFVLPESRRFELHLIASSQVIKGNVNLAATCESREQAIRKLKIANGGCWKAQIKVREVIDRNKTTPKITYTLIALLERLACLGEQDLQNT